MDSLEAIKRAEDKVLAVYQWAESKYSRQLELPEVSFNLRGLTAGLAYPRRNLIRLNLDMLCANVEDFIAETVPHEIAHLLAWRINGLGAKPHGPEWKAIMLDMGLQPTVCHDYEATRVRAGRAISRVFYYGCACPGARHELGQTRHNRFLRGVKYRCNKCRTPVRYIGPGVRLLLFEDWA